MSWSSDGTLVLIIKLSWICILFIFINIPGIYLGKKKGCAETKSITPLLF